MREGLRRFSVSVLLLVCGVAGALTLVAVDSPEAVAQRTATVTLTVYVPTTVFLRQLQTIYQTAYQTVYATTSLTFREPVTVTEYAPGTTVTTLLVMTFTTESSVTKMITTWSNWTGTQNPATPGVFGTLPSQIFGPYSELVFMATGALIGILVPIAIPPIFGMRRKANSTSGEDSSFPQQQKTKTCMNCGTQIPFNSQFCEFCGSAQQ